MVKKVLIFSVVYHPDFVGGAEVAVKEITDRIEADEVEFHMVTLRTQKSVLREEKIGNITVHRIGLGSDGGILFVINKYLFPLNSAFWAGRLHRIERFDMVWSIMANYAGFGALFFKLLHMNVPFLLTLQEGDPLEFILKKTRFVSGLFRMIFTHATGIQAISHYLANFAKSMGASADPVVVPNGVNFEAFSSRAPEAELKTIWREIGKKEDDVFLVTASRLVPKNGIEDIINALSHLPPRVKLLIVGKGNLERSLKMLVSKLSLGERVVFKGYVDHTDLPAYLQACDIFIRPSISEGFGNAFIEAMAAGLPVIATPVGGIVDFLKDKQTGLFCEVHSPQDIARKVEIYLHDKGLRDEIVDNALHMVVDHYDWKIIAREMKEKVFDGILKE